MASPFVAEIRIFAGNFAPKGWAFCNGQILPISQNTALFSLLGTTYGGDGKSNFALPNLQGSAPMHQGQGPGLTLRDLGEAAGSDTVTLLLTETPAHSHAVTGATSIGTSTVPGPNSIWAASGVGRTPPPLYSNTAPNVGMAGLSIAGGGLPHNNMQPFLGLTFIIALQGIFPARN